MIELYDKAMNAGAMVLVIMIAIVWEMLKLCFELLLAIAVPILFVVAILLFAVIFGSAAQGAGVVGMVFLLVLLILGFLGSWNNRG